MRGLSTSSTRPNALSPYLYGRYNAPKQRWWPLFACLGVGGMFALALLPQPPQGPQSTQRPLVHSAVGSPVLAAGKPAGKDVAQVPRIPDEAADDSTPARVAEPAPTRDKTLSKHSSKHRASGHRYAARKSHHREGFSVTHAMARIHGRAMALTAVATAVGLSTRLQQHQPHLILAVVSGLA